MKNMLQAAALILLTALVILAAARSHGHVREKCTQEWTRFPGMQQIAVNE